MNTRNSTKRSQDRGSQGRRWVWSLWIAVVACITLVPAVHAQFGPEHVINKPRAFSDINALDVADFDGDGDADIMGTSSLDGEVFWYENTDGQGTFGTPQRLTTPGDEEAWAAFAADYDGDGDQDILGYTFSFSEDDHVFWYENTDGQGAFGPQRVILTTDNDVRALIVADIDGDNDQDIVVSLFVSSNTNPIVWYENTDGQGTLGPAQDIGMASRVLQVLLVVDLDDDGDQDVVVPAGLDGASWYENIDGAGTFGEAQRISVSREATDEMVAADVDGDKDIDLLAASRDDDRVFWYENLDGQGNFGLPRTIDVRVDGVEAFDVADVEGDGDVDLFLAVVPNTLITAPRLIWYENVNGQGTFGEQQVITATFGEATSLVAADLDEDGDQDLLAGSRMPSTIGGAEALTTMAWYENTDGEGAFVLNQDLGDGDAGGAASVFVTDLDGDLDLDVIVGAAFDSTVVWYENLDGRGSFGPQRVIANGAAGFVILEEIYLWVMIVKAADVDGDGDQDVVSISGGDGKLAWYENTDGQGTFGPPRIISNEADGGRGAIGLHIADLDGDGDQDLLSASSGNGRVAWYQNTDGLGSFSPARIIATDLADAGDVSTADLDGDGDQDVIATSGIILAGCEPNCNDLIVWYENRNGLGNFGSPQEISASVLGKIRVLAADVDEDGDQDVLSGGTVGSGMVWHENEDGAGGFTVSQNLQRGANIEALFTADLDGGGNLDLLMASNRGVFWYDNIGSVEAQFARERRIVDDVARSVFAADIDGDGDQDVLAASSSKGKVAWYENQEIVTAVDLPEVLPEVYRLTAPYPNPFRNTTRFHLTLNQAQYITVDLFDVLGRRVRQVYAGWLPAHALHEFSIEAEALPVGVYLYRVVGEAFTASGQVLLAR